MLRRSKELLVNLVRVDYPGEDTVAMSLVSDMAGSNHIISF